MCVLCVLFVCVCVLCMLCVAVGGSVGEGIGWAIGVGGCSLVQTLSQSMFFFSSARGGLRVLGALNVCVFRKSMLLSVSATQQSGTRCVRMGCWVLYDASRGLQRP